jgi:hypothetical protein
MNLRNKNRTHTRFAAVALCLGGLLAASVTFAGGTHSPSAYYDDDGYGRYHDDDDDGFGRRGKRNLREPRFYDRGDQLRADVQVRGLRRNRNIRAKLDATALVEIECSRSNRYWGGGDRLRRRLWLEVDGVEFFSRHRIRNGRLDIDVETDDIRSELRGYYGSDLCPGRARARVHSVQFSDARLQITQEGRSVETWLCSFDRNTRNGPVPRRNVECVTLY